MKRRNFIANNLALGGAAVIPGASMGLYNQQSPQQTQTQPEVVIERVRDDKPHAGKNLAVIQPHCDDIPLYAAGLVAKLIHEGYTGYLIRTSNDEAAGLGATYGERVLNNEKDNFEVEKILGLKKTYDLHYANHRMEQYNIQEIKGRLIFLFRMLKIDTLVSYDPYGLYEENPDHYVTARAVEAARWQAAAVADYPEQLDVVQPYTVREMYYHARGPQIINRVVDISRFIDKKIEVNIANVTQGPAGNTGANLRRRLASEGRRLPLLGNDDATANYNYVKEFVLARDRENGAKYGLEWAECFHYIGPRPSRITEYIRDNAVPL